MAFYNLKLPVLLERSDVEIEGLSHGNSVLCKLRSSVTSEERLIPPVVCNSFAFPKGGFLGNFTYYFNLGEAEVRTLDDDSARYSLEVAGIAPDIVKNLGCEGKVCDAVKYAVSKPAVNVGRNEGS